MPVRYVLLLFAFMMVVLPCAAVAADLDTLQARLCDIVTWMTGSLGKSIGIIAVMLLGFGAMSGKVNGQAIMVLTIALALLFGAVGVVKLVVTAIDGSNDAICGQTGGDSGTTVTPDPLPAPIP